MLFFRTTKILNAKKKNASTKLNSRSRENTNLVFRAGTRSFFYPPLGAGFIFLTTPTRETRIRATMTMTMTMTEFENN